MLTGRATGGFTLIELMVAIAIAAVLLTLGVPAMSTYLQRAKVGAVTQSLQSSLQAARAEAIRRNQQVDFITTAAPVAAASAVAAPSPAGAGQNWVVLAPHPSASGSFTMLDVRAAADGDASTGAPSIEIQASGPFGGTVSFDGFGRTVGAAAYHFNVVHVPTGYASAPVASQAVQVSAGGKVSTCYPFALVDDSRPAGEERAACS